MVRHIWNQVALIANAIRYRWSLRIAYFAINLLDLQIRDEHIWLNGTRFKL
jgi:hypothetical protein